MEKEVRFTTAGWRYVKRSVNLNNFTISYTEEGGFSTKEKAEEAKEIDDAQYELDLKRIKKMANIQYTFKEYVEYWLTDIFLPNTETCTKAFGIWAVRNLIEPNIDQDVLLNYVTTDYINDIINRTIPICDSASETSLKYLKKMLRDAYEFGLIPKDIRSSLMRVQRKAPHIELVNKEDLKKIIQEASKHPGYYFEILLGVFAGFRSGEIRGLRYEDFDRENHTIRISRQYTANYNMSDCNDHFIYSYSHYMEEKSPKADSARIIKVADFLFEELEKKKAFNHKIIENRKALGQQDIDYDYVSISPLGHRKDKNSLLASIKRVCNYAGVKPISFHTLRHQFATILIEKGVPLEEISKLLGHKSVLTTFNTYCGVMEADKEVREVIDTMIPYTERLDK